ncbi:MAG: hypothetical protein JSU94_18210 [Phycisphaerales bacterium]|nr:MAG: hypothetical protein JSU94_18210 [Phycisphaerales bacterium]
MRYGRIIPRAFGFAIMLTLCAGTFTPCHGRYEITWHSIDAGGGTSTGGRYSLTGTIGQPDAASSAGGNYELLGGFLPGEPPCIVEFDDFARFAEYWLGGDPGADLNEDEFINFTDVQVLSDYWLGYCPHGWVSK